MAIQDEMYKRIEQEIIPMFDLLDTEEEQYN